FNTGNNVAFNGIGIGYMTALQQVATGGGNDSILNARSGLRYETGAGNDTVDMFGAGPITVWGGLGDDVVQGNGRSNTIVARDVETINAEGGNDSVAISRTDEGDVVVNGGAGSDSVAISAEINGIVTTNDVESVLGSSGNDHI